MRKPLPRHRTDQSAAKEILTRLIPSSATRRAVGRLVAEVADAARSVAPNSWELTLRRDNFFLNVGQVAVLTVYRDVISLYTEPLPRKPARLDDHVDGRKEGVYFAVPVPSVILRMSHERVTSVEPEIVRALRAFVIRAANAKSASPWKAWHSPAAVDVLARACGRRISQPGYYGAGSSDDEDTTTSERDLAAELASSREVEQAAIRIVTDRYRKNGWSVTSREAAKVGYDLLCKRGREVAHVEVKGRAQDGDVVIVTSGEWKLARKDKHWRLAIVAYAASKAPVLTEYPGATLQRNFSVMPVAFRLRRNDRG